ncbi:MAG: DJ-1/PfpI family protein [Minisyncoccales bacterium]
MKKLFLILVIVILILAAVFSYYFFLKPKNFHQETNMPEQLLQNKKIAFIIAWRDFRDEEYFVPKEILEKAGAEIKTVSTQLGEAKGADGGTVNVDLLLNDLNVADFDAFVFVGGPGALNYLDNQTSYEIIKEIVRNNKVLAAICIAPSIIAKSGALTGKKATVWSSALIKEPIKVLEQNGLLYQNEAVVVDGKLITANGPAAAKSFAEAIKEVLK